MVRIDTQWLQPVSVGVERYRDALATIPPPGQGCHPALLRVANLGIAAGIGAETVVAEIRSAIPEGTRRVTVREIRATVDKAAKEVGSESRTWTTRSVATVPRIDGMKIRNRIIAGGSEDEADLWEASPVRLDGEPERDAQLLLDTLYADGDYLFIGGLFDRPVRRVADWCSVLNQHGPRWPHIMPNPVDGQVHEASTGTPSWRCDAAVCGFRFAVAEFDELPRAEQLAFWSGVVFLELFDVAALIDSGGKSVHAWLRVDCPDRETWERDIEQGLFGQWLAPMGVDPACRNESRLSRLPGHCRQDSGNRQRLLYLAG